MDHKLKLRIGQHEFEAEGPQEWVDQQFATFRTLINQPFPPVADGKPPPDLPQVQLPNSAAGLEAGLDNVLNATTYARIFRDDGQFLCLTALPQGQDREGDAVLLLLLGQRAIRQADQVSGDQLLKGLQVSGYAADRADRIVSQLPDGLVMKSGQRRGTKYRLTIPGLVRARALADELMGLLG